MTARIGRASLERTVILLDTFCKALEARGILIVSDEHGVAISVDDELFWMTVSETRDRKPHQPTSYELKRQAEDESWRARYPDIYPSPSKSKCYRSWDYFPSGRLSFALRAEWRDGWNPCYAGRWYDRPTKKVEAYFNDAVVALFATTALIKHKRAEADETARLEAVAAEQRRREEARRERANNRAKYLKKKADDYAELVKLDAFASQLELRTKPHGQAGIDRIAGELRARLETMRDGFSREAMNTEISKLGLYTEDDGNGFEHPFA